MARFAQCKATIQIGDDYGDNPITFRCGKGDGHQGEHIEMGQSAGWDYRFVWSPSNNAVHLTPAAVGSRDDNNTEP